LFLASVPLVAGCYVYVPAQLETVPPQTEVRVFVSRQALANIPVEVANNGSYLTGQLAGRSADSVRVFVPVATRADMGLPIRDLRQEVRVPASQVLQVERREFSRGRTALLVAGGVGAAAGIIGLITGSITGAGDGGPGDDLIRIPLFIGVP
jgi:hypothetical protein